jgi:hypothetical protein
MHDHFTPQEILAYAGVAIAVAVLCYGLIWGKFMDRVFGQVALPNTEAQITNKKTFLKNDAHFLKHDSYPSNDLEYMKARIPTVYFESGSSYLRDFNFPISRCRICNSRSRFVELIYSPSRRAELSALSPSSFLLESSILPVVTIGGVMVSTTGFAVVAISLAAIVPTAKV